MPLKSTSLSQQLANHLSEKIIRRELQPGERLPEAEFAKQLSVSTNSLREAFHLLEKCHLIEWRSRRGAMVCEVTEEQVRELYEFLFLLLSQLAGRVAERWTGESLSDFVHALPQLREFYEQDDIANAHQLTFKTVVKLVKRFADNRYCVDSIIDLIPLLKRYSYMALEEETTQFGQSLETFESLLTATMERDVNKATELIRDYGNSQCQIVLRAIAKRKAA